MKYLKLLNATAFLLLMSFVMTSSAFAQGRDITPADWAERLPVLFLVIVVVVVVDLLFIFQIRKKSAADDRSIWERKDV